MEASPFQGAIPSQLVLCGVSVDAVGSTNFYVYTEDGKEGVGRAAFSSK